MEKKGENEKKEHLEKRFGKGKVEIKERSDGSTETTINLN